MTHQKIKILDGSYGDHLLAKHPILKGFPDLANQDFPESVLQLHQDYQKAGAGIILSNTFGCTHHRLLTHDVPHLQQHLLIEGLKLARAGAAECLVAACLGPQGLSPSEPIQNRDFLKKNIAQCCETIAQHDADLILFETQYHFEEILLILETARETLNNAIPLWLSITVNEQGEPYFAHKHPDWLHQIEDGGVQWLGFNCSFGPKSIEKAILKIYQQTQIPLTAKPNKGLPNPNGLSTMHDAEFIEGCQQIAKLGVSAMGGCCGTTPEIISKLHSEFQGLG